jgi:hypothetical protein
MVLVHKSLDLHTFTLLSDEARSKLTYLLILFKMITVIVVPARAVCLDVRRSLTFAFMQPPTTSPTFLYDLL